MERKKTLTQVIVISLITSICFFMFLMAAYHYDNKYTDTSLQPINGILSLTEQNIEGELFFPTRGWQYYSGQLLTPSDFSRNDLNYSLQFITLGKYNDFSNGQQTKSPYGVASYRLVLDLPETPHIYALSIPEIYSSYHLYLNSDCILSMGVPETKESRVGKQYVTFEASGRTSLLFSVQNNSHYYGGLTFPPAFGLANIVQSYQNGKLFLHSLVIVLLFLLCCFSCYFGIRLKNNGAITITAISLCILFQSAYPVFYTFFSVQHQWYFGFELLSIYGCYLFYIKLQNIYLNGTTIGYRFFHNILFAFMILSFLYGIIANSSVMIHLGFSILVFVLKLSVALYLIVNTFYSAYYCEPYAYLSAILASVISVTLIADRVFPLYEPIYGGFFTEYSGFIAVVFGACYLWFHLTEAYRFQLTLKEEKKILTRQVAIQKSHYLELTDRISETRKQRHDIRHHLKTISTFLSENKVEDAIKYLADCNITIVGKESFSLCENTVADALLQYYKKICSENHIDYQVNFQLPNSVPMEDIDLSILLGNLLENAYDACSTCSSGTPYIHIKGQITSNGFACCIENRFDGKILKKGTRFYSTKHDGFGIGTESIKTVVEKYHGIIQFETTNETFKASLLLSFF